MAAASALVGGVVALRAVAPSTVAERVRRRGARIRSGAGEAMQAAAAAEEEHYRTLRVMPGASKAEVKKAFRHLALQYHPDVVRRSGGGGGDGGIRADDFQRISVAYQAVMGSMREADERLEYWRCRYGLSDEELARYRYYLNEDGNSDDDW